MSHGAISCRCAHYRAPAMRESARKIQSVWESLGELRTGDYGKVWESLGRVTSEVVEQKHPTRQPIYAALRDTALSCLRGNLAWWRARHSLRSPNPELTNPAFRAAARQMPAVRSLLCVPAFAVELGLGQAGSRASHPARRNESRLIAGLLGGSDLAATPTQTTV